MTPRDAVAFWRRRTHQAIGAVRGYRMLVGNGGMKPDSELLCELLSKARMCRKRHREALRELHEERRAA